MAILRTQCSHRLADGNLRRPAPGLFADEEHEQRDCGDRGDDSQGKERANLPGGLAEALEQRVRQKRPEDGPRLVEAPMQTKGSAAPLRRRQSREQGVARRPAYRLAEPLDDTEGEHLTGRAHEHEHYFGERRQAVAEDGDRFPLTEAIGKISRRHVERGGGKVGNALDGPEDERARAEYRT